MLCGKLCLLFIFWKNPNKKSFDNLESNVNTSYANIILMPLKLPRHPNPQFTMAFFILHYYVGYPPIAASVKLNADGCWYESSGKAGLVDSFEITKDLDSRLLRKAELHFKPRDVTMGHL